MDNLSHQLEIPQTQGILFKCKPHSRNILYLKFAGSAGAILDGLTDEDWITCETGDPKEAEKLVKSRQVSVGVILFNTDFDEYHLAQISDLLTLSGVKWVALVSDDCLRNNKIIQLIGECFFDYHKLPIDSWRLSTTLGHACGMAQLEKLSTDQLLHNIGNNSIIGNSSVMQKFKNKITRVAKVDAPVLIIGESGTGKELAAHAVHDQSNRSSGPFEAVNCAALPASLIQSELFGHEKGAFTGAGHRKIGCFEAANGGTIFLDEIGDLSLELQINLLRIIEQKVVRRVGGTRDVPIDIRVVAATHIDLEKAVKEKRFREDLYYRLNVLRLDIPPLREREDDVELLAHHFLKEFLKTTCNGVRGFGAQSLKAMRSYEWPGNVRELINCIQQASAMCDQALISPRDLGSIERRRTNRSPMKLDIARAQSEKQTIDLALRNSGKNISLAAKELGVSRSTVYRLVEKHGIEV